MKRMVLAAMLAALLAGSHAAVAHASEGQVVHGQVLVPMGSRMIGPVYADACSLSSVVATWATGWQGVFGYYFDVDPATRGHEFMLEPGAIGDLDITFRTDDPGTEIPFETRSLDGERGIVPQDATTAFVCMTAGAPTPFTYAAG